MARDTSLRASVTGKPASAVIVARQLVAALLDQIAGAPQQDRIALAARRAGVVCERAVRGRDGRIDLLARRAIGVADDLAGELVEDREGLGALDPLRRRSAAGRGASAHVGNRAVEQATGAGWLR